jgi:hypothetical protein
MGVDLSQAEWRKSSYSSMNGCVEIAQVGKYVAVRDSKDRQGPTLTFTPMEWDAFLRSVQAGEFDHS